MKKFEVTLTGHYEKTISVYAESPEQAAEKVQIVLFDTDLIDFSDEDFAYGEADIKEADEDGCEEHSAEDEDMEDGCCSDCPYFCPMCGEWLAYSRGRSIPYAASPFFACHADKKDTMRKCVHGAITKYISFLIISL